MKTTTTMTTTMIPTPPPTTSMHCRFAPQRPQEARISQATQTEGRSLAVPRALRRSWTREGPDRGGKKFAVDVAPVVEKTETETETS